MKHNVPVFLAGALVAVGTFWSFQRGGHDFAVFYHAWNLVVHGHGTEIYVNSPDRFLYAPGFAWALAPVGFFSQRWALAFWDLAKAGAVFWLIQAFASWLRDETKTRHEAAVLAAGGVLLCARPFLIDFQYGQVNTFILVICCWAILDYFKSGRGPEKARHLWLPWFFLGFVAASKIFALPLILLPWFRERTKGTRRAQLASIGGIAIALFLPILTLGPSGGAHLLADWMGALAGKGLPLETHNQSFIALIEHYFTSAPTHVIALGPHWIVLGDSLLNARGLAEAGLAWSFLSGSLLLGWILHSKKTDPIRWTAVAVGLLFVPSYLVWKPYFVLTYPLAVLMLSRHRDKIWLIALGFIAMNLTGFDFLGGAIAARLEGASIFLLVHLAYLGCVIWSKPSPTASRQSASAVLLQPS